MQQLRNYGVKEERRLTSIIRFTLKSAIFNKRNTCIYIGAMLLGYLTMVCLVHILIHYFPCNVAKHILS